VVEVVPDPRARDTFDAEIPDESPHGRNESDNSSPGAAGGQTEHAQAVAGVEAAMKTLPPVAKTSAQQYVFSTWEKFGWLSSIFLVGGLVVLLAAIGFLAFLWFGNWSNHTWNNIATQNWFTRAVSLSALAVRNAVSLQAGVATSMLASVALEQMEVHILSAASISCMRNATSGPYFFTWSMLTAAWKRGNFRQRMLLPILAVVLTITTVLVQFTSTALLADLSPGLIPSSSRNYTAATNFVYINGTDGFRYIPVVPRGTSWKIKAPFYPAFAEYHEDVADSTQQDGISDTGFTLRAFLPLQDQQARSNIRSYNGIATVLDSRVVCMPPNMTNHSLHLIEDTMALGGQVTAASNTTNLFFESGNGAESNQTWENRTPAQFKCVLPLALSPTSLQDWRLSICQPTTTTGYLANAFNSTSFFNTWSMYIVVNISKGGLIDWLGGVTPESGDQHSDLFGPGNRPLFFSNHNEWQDLLFNSNGSLRLSTTLCFTAFETADLAIEAIGNENRTEPIPEYDSEKQAYQYGRIRNQLGQPANLAPLFSESDSERGTLQLKKRDSWLPGPGDYHFGGIASQRTSFALDFANMFGPVQGFVEQPVVGGIDSPCTAIMYGGLRDSGSWTGLTSFRADPSLTALVQEILQQGGSIAFALQSILTTLAGIAYYDQLQQFNGVGAVVQSDFVLVTVPHSYRGFIAVVSVVIAHLLLLAAILWLFLARTEVSSLGNSWQTVSQLQGDELRELIAHSSLRTDSQVEKRMLGSGLRRRFVGIRLSDDRKNAEVVPSS
jgi:hypothetical protein